MRTLAFLAALTAAAAGAQEAPPVFRAETRAPLRAAPGGPEIGALAAGTAPIEASAVRDGWARVIHQEGDAWIPLPALTPIQPATLGGGLVPDGLVCAGAEPFWSLSLSADESRLGLPMAGVTALALAEVAAAKGRRFPTRLRFKADGAAWGDAVLTPQLCSDTMSDRSYPWSVSVLPAEGGLWTGCCRLPRAQ